MIRVVLDTNILISTTFWQGNPYKITELGVAQKVMSYTTQAILDEYAKVLERDFNLSREQIEKKLHTFWKFQRLSSQH